VPSHAVLTAMSAAVSGGDGSDALTWWLASVFAVAFVLAACAAVLLTVYQRRPRAPHPHYHRHTEPIDRIPPE
jgi:hypothetical protein